MPQIFKDNTKRVNYKLNKYKVIERFYNEYKFLTIFDMKHPDFQLIYNTSTICISQREDRKLANEFSPLRYFHSNLNMFSSDFNEC